MNKIPLGVQFVALLHYAGAFSFFIILGTLFLLPAGSFYIFDAIVHVLFLAGPGTVIWMTKMSAMFAGPLALLAYFPLLLFCCVLSFFQAESLLKGEKLS